MLAGDTRRVSSLRGLSTTVGALTRDEQRALKDAFRARALPPPLVQPWSKLCDAVASESARRWRSTIASHRDATPLLWRLLRITSATFFVLGTDHAAHLRFRIDSAWDWNQSYELRKFDVSPRTAGQPEVGWRAVVRSRSDRDEHVVNGHVEVRWSHGRFLGNPESKVYLDTPHAMVPGYHQLA